MEDFGATMADNWPYWVVTLFVIVAAYVDGKELRVPNKLTYPMIIAGWIYSCLLYTSPSPRDRTRSRMPSSA